MVVTGCQENKSCSKVLNFLERLDDRIRCTHKETVRINTIKRTAHAYNAQTLKRKEKKKKRKKKEASPVHPVHCICLLTPAHSGFQTERKRSKANARFANWAPSHGINWLVHQAAAKIHNIPLSPWTKFMYIYIYIYPLTA